MIPENCLAGMLRLIRVDNVDLSRGAANLPIQYMVHSITIFTSPSCHFDSHMSNSLTKEKDWTISTLPTCNKSAADD